MTFKKVLLTLLLGILLYAWTMLVLPASWSQILKYTGPITVEAFGAGVGLYPPREPELTASEKLQIREPVILGWENTPIIVWWHLDAFSKLWWGGQFFGYTAYG